MTAFASLARLFARDLLRRKLLWALVLLAVAGVALHYWTLRTLQEVMGQGASYSVATKRVASNLDALAGTIRSWGTLVVALFAAQVAPESRRNGTTQFVLSSGVRRDVLAAGQFAALAGFVVAGALLVHIGFSAAAVHMGAMTTREAALAWPSLVFPWLGVAAAVFAVSLTASVVETYLLFLGLPLLTGTLASMLHGMPHGVPRVFVRVVENVGLLFPDVTDLVLWPHTSLPSTSMPVPTFGWPLAQGLCGLAFWVLLGLWRHRRHDFGSRTAVK